MDKFQESYTIGAKYTIRLNECSGSITITNKPQRDASSKKPKQKKVKKIKKIEVFNCLEYLEERDRQLRMESIRLYSNEYDLTRQYNPHKKDSTRSLKYQRNQKSPKHKSSLGNTRTTGKPTTYKSAKGSRIRLWS